ncbi:MAG: hypothetical protein Q8O67_33380 [Deltaproteobacteria bacterium]|nr:hypothetical protein [Deltaproteobacteria bacterium]
MKALILALVATFALFTGGCSKPADVAAKADDKHAAANVKPGSHEDWCGEHAVPESQCTQCHPELAAAFKATNDWCAEHGLPESHCLKCHPDLKIVRPAKGM